MGAYKRPVSDGGVCEDLRVAHNPNIGQSVTAADPVIEKPVAKSTPKQNFAPKAQASVTEEKAAEPEVTVEAE